MSFVIWSGESGAKHVYVLVSFSSQNKLMLTYFKVHSAIATAMYVHKLYSMCTVRVM